MRNAIKRLWAWLNIVGDAPADFEGERLRGYGDCLDDRPAVRPISLERREQMWGHHPGSAAWN